MARVINNVIIDGTSGSIGNKKYTLRYVHGNTHLVRKPALRTDNPTTLALKQRELFAEAAKLARADLADETKAAEWARKINARHVTAYGVAFAHYYKQLKEA